MVNNTQYTSANLSCTCFSPVPDSTSAVTNTPYIQFHNPDYLTLFSRLGPLSIAKYPIWWWCATTEQHKLKPKQSTDMQWGCAVSGVSRMHDVWCCYSTEMQWGCAMSNVSWLHVTWWYTTSQASSNTCLMYSISAKGSYNTVTLQLSGKLVLPRWGLWTVYKDKESLQTILQNKAQLCKTKVK